MKLVIAISIMLSCIMLHGQSDFNAAAQAFENDEFEKTISMLAQLEAKVGANPRIESLRSFTYDQKGDKQKAYESVVRFFILAGRNGDSPGTKDMESLEQSLKISLANELKMKEQKLQDELAETTDKIVYKKQDLQHNLKAEKETAYNTYYEAKINNAKENFTAAELKLISENITSVTNETLNEKALQLQEDKLWADANNGDPEAMYTIASRYNQYVDRNGADSREQWLLKAAEKNYLSAIRELGMLYYFNGIKQDNKKAIIYLKRAADLGDLDAMDKVGNAYVSSFLDGVESDLDHAIVYYSKAAEKGVESSGCSLYSIYVDNQYRKKNKKLAEYWATKCNW